MNYKFIKMFDIVDVAKDIENNTNKRVFLDVIRQFTEKDPEWAIISCQKDVDQLCLFLSNIKRSCCIHWLEDKRFIAREKKTYPIGTVFKKTRYNEAGFKTIVPRDEYRVVGCVSSGTKKYFMMESGFQIVSQIEKGQETEISAEQVSNLLRTEKWEVVKRNSISDSFGNFWENECPECGAEMEVVRPGKVQCSKCG